VAENPSWGSEFILKVFGLENLQNSFQIMMAILIVLLDIYFIAWTDNKVLTLFGHRLADVDVASVPEAPTHHRHP
jgi:hypothetical protein